MQLAVALEAIARTITNPFWQASALSVVAEAAATAGDLDRAAAIARTITDPDRQASALSVVAEAAATASGTSRATCLAAGVALSGGWAEFAVLVVRVVPTLTQDVAAFALSMIGGPSVDPKLR